MTTPIQPVALDALAAASPVDIGQVAGRSPVGFTQLLSDGIGKTNSQLLEADRLTRAFALGEDIPVHQVTFALEEARLSFELMNQVRTRLVESYQEILRMQV
ncbi:MAG TPA: flagellar hook-basal body complex protein FliE [Brevundimonas sp.]|nr:flagellar hook-basal body complex protein FliE [Brevundimonas sp.]